MQCLLDGITMFEAEKKKQAFLLLEIAVSSTHLLFALFCDTI